MRSKRAAASGAPGLALETLGSVPPLLPPTAISGIAVSTQHSSTTLNPAADSARRGGPLRGTQSMVYILAQLVRQPRLIAIEIGWRWIFGIPALAVLYYQVNLLLTRTPLPAGGLNNFSLADPNAAASAFSNASSIITPGLEHLAWWLGPILAVGWAFSSGIGRTLLMQQLVPGSRPEPGALIGLQLLRIAALVGSGFAWLAAIHWVASATLQPTGTQPDFSPNLVGYFAWVICLSLGTFTLWALVSWVFSIAPLIAVLEKRGIAGSLWRSLRLGPLTPKLVEVNFVLGIVKMALVVLAMVFCATPLPFDSVANGNPLYLYWAFITVLYLAGSDFFQVARLAAFISFWNTLRDRDTQR